MIEVHAYSSSSMESAQSINPINTLNYLLDLNTFDESYKMLVKSVVRTLQVCLVIDFGNTSNVLNLFDSYVNWMQ